MDCQDDREEDGGWTVRMIGRKMLGDGTVGKDTEPLPLSTISNELLSLQIKPRR